MLTLKENGKFWKTYFRCGDGWKMYAITTINNIIIITLITITITIMIIMEKIYFRRGDGGRMYARLVLGSLLASCW